MIYVAFKHSRDIAILIVLLLCSIVHCSSLFQYIFLLIYYRPYCSWKFLIFNILVDILCTVLDSFQVLHIVTWRCGNFQEL